MSQLLTHLVNSSSTKLRTRTGIRWRAADSASIRALSSACWLTSNSVSARMYRVGARPTGNGKPCQTSNRSCGCVPCGEEGEVVRERRRCWAGWGSCCCWVSSRLAKAGWTWTGFAAHRACLAVCCTHLHSPDQWTARPNAAVPSIGSGTAEASGALTRPAAPKMDKGLAEDSGSGQRDQAPRYDVGYLVPAGPCSHFSCPPTSTSRSSRLLVGLAPGPRPGPESGGPAVPAGPATRIYSYLRSTHKRYRRRVNGRPCAARASARNFSVDSRTRRRCNLVSEWHLGPIT